nr:MAG: RNA-dependent RNA polymerase [Botourmiaviridae sp.]
MTIMSFERFHTGPGGRNVSLAEAQERDGAFPLAARSMGAWGLTIPLPFGEANYGEAFKQAPPREDRSVRGERDTCTHLCPRPVEGEIGASSRSLKTKLKEWRARQVRPRLRKSVEHTNSYALLEDADDDCTQQSRLRGKAVTCVELLAVELGLEPVRDLPPRIRCAELRPAVRGCFQDSLPLEAQLSIKTTQKLERSTCRSCEARVLGSVLKKWKEARFQPQKVDDKHLASFRMAMRNNIPTGWNRRKYPFIPNGNASESFKRLEGGNWNEEDFSRTCRVEAILSSGKPRVVTMYSSHNSKVLQPLHNSLYAEIGRYGWLLVGPPTAERISFLNGGGDYLSVDYTSATDNIKQEYVRASVDELIARAAPPLTPEEERCLRVVSELRFDDDAPPCPSGQPMGSLMSFPILCLVNKTINDLALTDLLQGGQLSFKEWTSHRLLVNGDDLLTKEPRKDSNLGERIFYHGGQVGLVSNWEKTLKSDVEAEINSTLFREGVEVKKTNVASFYMKPDTGDVLGYAKEASRTSWGFRKVVRANCKLLARQEHKRYRDLPYELQRICKSDRKIRRALQSYPEMPEGQSNLNLFPVDPLPEGYSLTREEEIELIHKRVEEVRPIGIRGSRLATGETDGPQLEPPKRKGASTITKSWRFVKYEKKPAREEKTILRVLARGWEAKQKRLLVEEEGWIPSISVIGPSDQPGGRASALVDAIRAFRRAEDLRREPLALAEVPLLSDMNWCPAPENRCPFRDGSEWIALE